MQFSLKWILVAVVYVAVAAAAFSQDSWVYADLLWAASLLAIVFAALLAFMGRGKGRVAAAGFLLAALAYVACVAFGRLTGSDAVPTKRWLMAAGYDPNSAIYTLMASSPMPQPATIQSSGAVFFPATPAAPSQNALSLSFTPSAVPPPLPAATAADFAIYVRAANAVSMWLFGAVGALVGLFAFKRISQTTPTPRG
jgi:hypothetical protein